MVDREAWQDQTDPEDRCNRGTRMEVWLKAWSCPDNMVDRGILVKLDELRRSEGQERGGWMRGRLQSCLLVDSRASLRFQV